MKEVLFSLEEKGFVCYKNFFKPKFDKGLFEKIKFCILNSKVLNCSYKEKTRTLEPLGIIVYERLYLIAREKEKENKINTYNLARVKEPSVGEETFEYGNFDLDKYAKEIFGIFRGDIKEVKLKFSPEIQEKIKEYNFDFSHKIEFLEDKSSILTFNSGGDIEIFRFIFRWGVNCEILSPNSLKESYRAYLTEILEKIN